MNKKILLALGLTAALTAGCSNQSGEPDPQKAAATVPPSVVSVLDAYESIRSDLASDRLPTSSKYEALSGSARRAMGDYQGTSSESLSRLATASDDASKTELELANARVQFGRISEPLIGFLGSQPELSEGRFIFECPMATGYPKWVQNSGAVSNPYMGLAMASCGVESVWIP